MTKPHITNPRDRATAKYLALHDKLRRELTKPGRKRAASASYRARGE